MSRQKARSRDRGFYRELAVWLTLLLVTGYCQPAMAQGDNDITYEQYQSGEHRDTADIDSYETIRIQDEEQLQDLAKACTFDAWSRDKRVLLEADLDLTDMELTIPVFSGIFDGQGHVIKGLVIRREGSHVGLFRYLQQEAVIQNLVVEEAKVLPRGSSCQAGVLVGCNYGSIISCKVSGMLKGEEEIGGIAGVNEASGEIRNCTAQVSVVGNRRTGGISGSNHGVINHCTNKGDINIYADDRTFDLGELTVENLEEPERNSGLDAHMDTGGIAGFSDGKIYYCDNSGVVGYAHVGYNIGGIVGRLHQGYIQNCTNTGQVLGRKDVGGITGQMEPFLEIAYIDGKLDALDRETDVFINLLETSHSHISRYGDQVTDITGQLNTSLGNLSDAMVNLMNITNDLWQAYNRELSGMSSDFDRLSDDLAGIEDHRGSENPGSVSGNDPGGGSGSAGSTIRDWGNSASTQEYREAVSDFADSTGKHLHNMTDATAQGSDQVTSQMEILDREMKNSVNRLSELTDTLEEAGDVLDADADALIGQARKLRRLISEIRDDLFGYEGITIENTSDEAPSDKIENTGSGEKEGELEEDGDTVTENWYDTTSFQQGKITLCLNRGKIEADSNVGGIVGQIATEYDLDPEEDIALTGSESMTIQESMRAVVRESRNEAAISSKKDCVGGVAGKADFGAIISCESYADIQSSDGSYVGGIAGRSDDTIRSCFSTGFIKGKSNVGGITGMGREIYCCDAMNRLDASGEKYGAIAGEVAQEGVLYDNYYVSGETDGVDGIGYEGGATALPYGEFVAREGLPEEFQILTLRFVVTDDEQNVTEEVACLEVPYGSGLTRDQLPELPEKEGFNGHWPQIDYGHITESMILEAEYTKWVTALEYRREDLVANQAAMLVEGCFYPEDVLEAEWTTEETGSICEFRIKTAEGVYDRPVSVRLHQSLLPKHYEIQIGQGDEKQKAESRVMGSYVVFRMEQPGTFRVATISDKVPPQYYVIGGVVLSVALIICIWRLIRGRKKRRKKVE